MTANKNFEAYLSEAVEIARTRGWQGKNAIAMAMMEILARENEAKYPKLAESAMKKLRLFSTRIKNSPCGTGWQTVVEFANGFSASIVCNPLSLGGEEGLREIAIYKDGKVCTNAPITAGRPYDVLGNLTDDEVVQACVEIASY